MMMLLPYAATGGDAYAADAAFADAADDAAMIRCCLFYYF